MNEIPSTWLLGFDDLKDFKLTEAQEKERFGTPVTNHESDVDKAIAARVPEKPRRQTAWGRPLVFVFRSWCSAHGEAEDVLSMSITTLQEKLYRFILEAHHQDGAPYPGKTLYRIVAGIQQYLHELAWAHEIGINS